MKGDRKYPAGSLGSLDSGTIAHVEPFGEVIVTAHFETSRWVRRWVDGREASEPMALDPLTPCVVVKTAAERYAGGPR